MRILWSNFRIYVFVLLFSFSIFRDRWSLKLEDGNNSMKTDCRNFIYRTRVPTVQIINIEIYPCWLELPLTGTTFLGPRPV